MFKRKNGKEEELAREKLQEVLAGAKKLSEEELAVIFGGSGDDRETVTSDPEEIYNDIWGSRF